MGLDRGEEDGEDCRVLLLWIGIVNIVKRQTKERHPLKKISFCLFFSSIWP